MLGKILKELRTEKNLTQKELALSIGCTPSMISRWEKEECEPTAGAILKLAKALDCSTDYLLGNTDI